MTTKTTHAGRSVTAPDRPGVILVIVSALIAVLGGFLGSGAVVGTPIAEAAGGALSATATLVAPAGPAFSIWSVIYAGLIAYAVWQALPAQQRSARQRVLRRPVAATMILNAAWILVVQWGQVFLSVVVIVALLASLAVVFALLIRHPGERTSTAATAVDTVVTDGTFGLYLGWVSIATVANTSAWLASIGWTGGATLWAVVVLVVAALVGLFLARVSGGRIAQALSLSWGLAWVAQGRLAGENVDTVVGWTAALAVAVVLVGTLALRVTARQRR
ncbi:TspO/MBR family protein [Rhodococcoides kroppenstedtii]|uniref:TspO/MBR family protein n=1 Tax=Rhodococcoides kroppenstedtii TaxID=293050 RepID=UPI002030A92D|nr:TspO/MBR family protein [Rhodococcus kroppenstedtii]